MLFTKANLAALPPLYSQDGQGFDAVAQVKLFGGGRFTYYVTERSEGNDMFFGYLLSPLGADCDEWCYFELGQLQELRFPPFGLRLERDRHFHPAPVRDCVGGAK